MAGEVMPCLVRTSQARWGGTRPASGGWPSLVPEGDTGRRLHAHLHARGTAGLGAGTGAAQVASRPAADGHPGG